MSTKILKVRHYKVGYEVRTELIDGPEAGGTSFEMKSAYTPSGKYIGNPKTAHFLCKKYGIAPELSDPKHNCCSIGFSKKDNKWYGWSHRAICGFTIGSKVDSKDHLCSQSGYIDEYIKEHPEEDKSLPVGFEAKTMEDAKKMAIAFADAVS